MIGSVLFKHLLSFALQMNKKDCVLNICSQHSDINDSNFVNSSVCFALLISSFLTRSQNGLKIHNNKNQIFELILEQCLLNQLLSYDREIMVSMGVLGPPKEIRSPQNSRSPQSSNEHRSPQL